VTVDRCSGHIAAGLPGTADLMVLVGDSWWRCAYAARGGNWPLAAFYARRVRSLQRRLAVIRPKYAERLAGFESAMLGPLFAALERQDRAAFDRAFAAATENANQRHEAALDQALRDGSQQRAADALALVVRIDIDREHLADEAGRCAVAGAPAAGEADDAAVELGDVHDARRVQRVEPAPPSRFPAV